MGQKDGTNKNKMVQDCVARVRQIRNENLMTEDLGLFDDLLQGYTLKKKKDGANTLLDITNSMEKKKKENESTILETKPEANLTEMLSEKSK